MKTLNQFYGSLYLPVKPKHINQAFGDKTNLQWYRDHGIIFLGHNGIDYAAKHGQPIYASHDGAAYYEVDGSSGHGVVICSDELVSHDGVVSNYKTIYWHMCDPVKEPKYRSPIYGNIPVKVKAGDLIGYADSTGVSGGDHLHFGFKWGSYGEPPAKWFNLNPDNGYNGASDPTPYMSEIFAADLVKFRYDLYFGMVDVKVVELQNFLGISPNGPFGPKTLAAVRKFQSQNGILSTGYVGPKTRALLNQLTSIVK